MPSAFVPDEDEGYFISVIQAPPGASLEYTTHIATQAEVILFKDPDIRAAFSVAGFSFSGAAPNNGLIFTRLKDYAERPGRSHSLQAVLGRIRGPMMGIPGALVIPFAPPGIQGLSVFGGFQYELLDQTGGDISRLASTLGAFVSRANQSGRVMELFSSFRTNDPQLVVDIDRDKARSLDLPLSEVTDALQVFLGSLYVNDFDFNNRAYRVYVQADQQYRSDPNDLRQFYARAANAAMVPLDNVVRTREATAPQVISHFNLFRSAEINGVPAPGLSSGEALAAMEQLSREALPPGFDFAWAGQSLEEVKAGAQVIYIFALSLVIEYLVLAAQYESWLPPSPVREPPEMAFSRRACDRSCPGRPPFAASGCRSYLWLSISSSGTMFGSTNAGPKRRARNARVRVRQLSRRAGSGRPAARSRASQKAECRSSASARRP